MNKQYKVIWSKVKNGYVVVSELAKNNGKASQSKIGRNIGVALSVLALCAGMTSVGYAADTATGTGSGVAYGTGSKAPNAASVAVGNNANASGDFSIALGLQANSSGYLSIAQGYAAQASGLQSVAIGLQTQATNEAATAIGRSVQATGIAAIGIGLSGVAAGNDSIVMGRDATATTTAVNGIALGIGSYIGAEVTPGGQPSVGVPDNSLNVTDDDTSSGKPNQDHMNSVALGNTAKAYGYQNTSLGAGAETYNTNSLAVGVAAHARGNYASAIGKQANADGLESTALGHWARAYGDNTIAIGTNSITFSLDGTTSVNNAIAIGQKARVASNNSVALGQKSLAYIPDSVKTVAYLTDEAFAAENGVVSVGNAEYTIGDDKVAANRRRITNVAGGADDYDAVNVAQLKAVNNKVDANKISFFSVNPTGSTVTSNADNAGATGTHAMAIGIDASATGTEGVAIGKAAVSTGATSISMGKKSNASGSSSIAIGQSAASSASNTIAIGNSTEATYNYTVALGHSAKATALQGVAIGPYAKAEKDSSVAIGYFAKATDGASNGVSIGRSASVTKSNGVALGYISVADRASGVTGYNPLTQAAPGASNAAIAQAWGFADEYNALNTQLSDTSLTTEQKNAIRSQINKLISPYKSGYGAVSVGTGESTRQIINVAAGTEDSDAVNLAQLKALANKVDSDKTQYFSVKSTITGNQDNSGATGTDTIAIGPNAKARYTGGIAIGKDASAAAGSMAALAIGYETSATGVASTALGVRAKATGSSVTAVGFDSVIKTASSGSGRTGDYSVAMGVSSLVDGGKSAIAIGNNAYAIDTTQATVVGTGAMVSALPQNTGDSIVITDGSQGTKTITKDDDGEYNVESTKESAATLKARNGEAYGATALGSRATAHNLGAVAVGLYSTAIGDTSVAVGNNSMTLKDSAVAVGSGTIASAEDALSLGSYANASKDTSVALGAYAKTDRGAGELFGYVPGLSDTELTTFKETNANSIVWNSNRGAVSVGIKGKETRQITNVAAGTEDTDAVNVAQLKAVNSKVDVNKISFFSVNPEGFVVNSNEDNKGATGSHAMAIGIDASATGQFSAAIGEGALASASDAIAIGTDSKSTGNMATAIGERSEASASSAVALGSAANATQNYAIAIGGSAKAENYRTIAMGPYANALEENSIAIGYFATASEGAYDGVALGRSANVSAENGLALGRSAVATMTNGIALGSYSVTDRDGNYLGYDPNVGGDFVLTTEMQAAMDAANEAIYNRNQNPTPENDQIALEAIKKYKLLVAPWVSGASAVSIGNKEEGLTRQITNVAAGSNDTDAVNVAQLKQLSEKVAQVAEDTILKPGDNITITTTTNPETGAKTNTIDLKDTITLGDDTTKQVTIDGNAATVTAGSGDNQVKVDGSKGQVVIGDGNQGSVIIGNQDNGKGETGDYITGLDNTKWDAKNVVEDRAATEGQLRDAVNSISTEIGDINTDIEAIQNAKREFISDTGTKIEVGNAETLSIKGGADSTSLTESNIGVVNDGTKGFRVKLSNRLSDLQSVDTVSLTAETATIGATTIGDAITVGSGNQTTVIADSGITVKATDSAKSDITLTSDTISMGRNQVHDVAAGTADTDAVNVSQLNSAVTNIGSNMNYLGNQINKLDSRVNRVGAGAAALAALHPLDYNPMSRWEFAAGVGNYKGANAVAVGAFFRPHSDLMFSMGSSFGGGENMVNAGVTWRVGTGQATNYGSSQAMSQEINSLRGVVNSQQSMLKSQNEKLEAQSVQLEEQKQQIEQLLQAVAELKK